MGGQVSDACGILCDGCLCELGRVCEVSVKRLESSRAVDQSPRHLLRSFERGTFTAIIITASETSHWWRGVVWRIAHSLRPAVCNQITFSAPREYSDGSMPVSVMLVKIRFQGGVIKSHLLLFLLSFAVAFHNPFFCRAVLEWIGFILSFSRCLCLAWVETYCQYLSLSSPNQYVPCCRFPCVDTGAIGDRPGFPFVLCYKAL